MFKYYFDFVKLKLQKKQTIKNLKKLLISEPHEKENVLK
jgi:hypothetical protein